MTFPPSTTSNSSILRSPPRYTSTSTNDDNVVVVDTSPPSSGTDTATINQQISANNKESVVKHESTSMDNNNNKPTTIRTLSDLVQSSINLSSEAHGTKDIERGNIISHRPKNSQLQQQQNDIGKVKENNNVVESKVPTTTLLISKDGKPYLSDTPVNNIEDIKERAQDMSSGDISLTNQQQTSSGPQVVDIMGIMDNDTKNVVRFCELGEVEDDTMDNNGSSSRDRLEQRIPFENDIEDVNMDDDSLNNKGGCDDEEESCSSSGSDQDDEILKES